MGHAKDSLEEEQFDKNRKKTYWLKEYLKEDFKLYTRVWAYAYDADVTPKENTSSEIQETIGYLAQN